MEWMGDGSVVEAIRRVPPYLLWAGLSTFYVVFLRIIAPESERTDYLFGPILVGVAFIVSRLLPNRQPAWLAPIIGSAVAVAATSAWRALS